MIKEFKITNPEKIIYPNQKIKKIDVINYYLEVSAQMLPHIKERLLSVIRCHDGIDGERFFKNHVANDREVEAFNYNGKEFFYIKNQRQLLYQAQMGTIEFHPWGSKVKKINCPDVMVFDLDPDEDLSLNQLRDAVLCVKSVLDALSLKSYLKTSGGKGYHILVPFKKSSNWDSFYNFSKNIAQILEGKWQTLFTTNVRKAERKNKIFVDYLRNASGATCVAPYSLRAKDGAFISMPISWDSLHKVAPNEVNILNYKKYLNDSWRDYFITRQKIN